MCKTMATATAVKRDRGFTYDDYLIWDLGPYRKYELIGGEFFMTPAPTFFHQRKLRELGIKIAEFLKKTGQGEVVYAPVDVILSDTDVIQPDIVFISKDNYRIIKKKGVVGSPDLVVEIVSKNSKKMDYKTKRELYEKHRIKEYWIVDQENEEIKVLVLDEGKYKTYGIFRGDDITSSKVLTGFSFKTKEVF